MRELQCINELYSNIHFKIQLDHVWCQLARMCLDIDDTRLLMKSFARAITGYKK